MWSIVPGQRFLGTVPPASPMPSENETETDSDASWCYVLFRLSAIYSAVSEVWGIPVCVMLPWGFRGVWFPFLGMSVCWPFHSHFGIACVVFPAEFIAVGRNFHCFATARPPERTFLFLGFPGLPASMSVWLLAMFYGQSWLPSYIWLLVFELKLSDCIVVFPMRMLHFG